MKKELQVLKNSMKERGLDAYIIKVGDRHGSESVAPAFRFLEYVSGFTGSRALLIVTNNAAGLWTDSRYFIQAESELEGSGIDLYKEKMPGTISPSEFLIKTLQDNDTQISNLNKNRSFLSYIGKKNFVIGVDGNIFSYGEINGLHLSDAGTVRSEDLADVMWENRPCVPPKKVRIFDGAGEETFSKLEKIREVMKKRGASYHIISTLEDIAWALNLRGSDIPHVPVFYSYLVVGKNNAWLFAYEEAFESEIKNYLNDAKVALMPYESFYEKLPEIITSSSVMVNPAHTSFKLWNYIFEYATIIQAPEPTILLKAQKNKTEIAGIRAANILDGAAMCKFLYWIKSEVKCCDKSGIKQKGKSDVDNSYFIEGYPTEISIEKKLHEIRKSFGAIDESFETIAAYASHAAIVHYSANLKTNRELLPEGFLLVDSGAHYEGGTTDITRTIALGPLTDEMKLHYTLVLMGHIDYAMAHFPLGTSLLEIDALAHSPLRAHNLDYYHGTSHGIGHVLSVHESLGSAGMKATLKPGMVMSDEPGVYIEGSHGIRIEGDLFCVKEKGNDSACGNETASQNISLKFEMLTLCPYEREAIISDMLSSSQKDWINSYHAKVRDVLLPYLDKDEQAFLIDATKEI